MSDADTIARKYVSPRASELDNLERYVSCTQYEGKVGWFDTASEAPLFERKPCVNYPISKTAIGSHVAFVLGEGRWPNLTCSPSENDESIDDEWGLDEDDSETFDAWVNLVLVKRANLKELAREMLHDAMASRSVAVVACVRNGQLVAETVKAAWCTPTLDDSGDVLALEIRYPYIQSQKNEATGDWEDKCLLYRRTIDATSDTVYLPGIARENGKEPVWAVDKNKTRDHGLGFCPVIWYPFLKPCSVVNEIDGVAIHEHQLGEIDCLNRSLSQRHRAAVTAGDPQAAEFGVAEDENVGPTGVTSTGEGRGEIKTIRDQASDKSVAVFGARTSRRANARKRGAGVIWRYKSDKARAELLTLPGDALKVLDDDARDLRDKIAEALFAVFVDPSSLKMHAAMSAKALAFLFSRQVGFCDQIRQNFAEKALLPLISMLLRIVSVVGRKGPRSLRLPGLVKILPILERFEQKLAGKDGKPSGAIAWMPPRVEPVWGPYFPPNEQDQLFVVQLTTQAKDGGLITTKQGVEKLSKEGVFDVGSAGEVVEAIKAEKDEATKAAQATMHALTKTQASPDDGDKGGAGGLDGGAAAVAA